MIIICYDIHNTKTRTKLSKYLEKFGRRIQFSIFEIDLHYSRTNEIEEFIKSNFRPKLKNNDSIIIMPFSKSDQARITRYGAKIQEPKRYITYYG
jgi:CRISPR-associated protein Cas2